MLQGLDQGNRDLTWQKWSYQVKKCAYEFYICFNMFLLCPVRARSLSYRFLLKQVGLQGETMNLVSPNEASSFEWTQASLATQGQQPLTWYKVKEISKLLVQWQQK